MEKYTIRSLHQLIDQTLQPIKSNSILVEGEISNVKLHRNGYVYFNLKDSTGKIDCYMPQNILQKEFIDGKQIVVLANVKYSNLKGTVGLYILKYKFIGIGKKLEQLQILKEQLRNEGIFSQNHKKQLPEFAFDIGIITASPSAALTDVLKVIQRKCPIVNIKIYPTLVQGEFAADNIIEQLLIADGKHDVLLLVRGGGSIEDLWCFNDEQLVRTIFQLKTPIISGVGHQQDITLVDYVCDVRAATPTAACEEALFDLLDVKDKLFKQKSFLLQHIKNQLEMYQLQMHYILSNFVYHYPKKMVENHRFALANATSTLYKTHTIYVSLQKQLQDVKHEINRIMQMNIIAYNKKLQNTHSQLISLMKLNQSNFHSKLLFYTTQLDLLSPLKILQRGYSVVKKDNIIINTVHKLHKQDSLILQFQDGIAKAIIQEVKHGTKL